METDFLNAFVLTVETGSMAEAARRLAITPATVAQQIRVIETTLDTELVVRSGRRVVPTGAGLLLLEHARDLIGGFSSLKAKVNVGVTSGEIRVGAIHSAQHSILPDAISDFAHLYPAVKILLSAGTTLELYECLLRDELDVVFGLLPHFPLPKSMTWELIREEPLVLLAAAKFAGFDPHHLVRTEPFIRYHRSLSGGQQADRYLQRAGLVPNERFEFTSLVAISMMVDRELGVSVAPDVPMPQLAALRVLRIPLPAAAEPRLFGMLRPRVSPRKSLLDALAESAGRAAAIARR